MKVKLTCCVIAMGMLFLPCFSMALETQKIIPSDNFAITPTPESELLKNEESVEPPKLFANQFLEFGLMYHYFDYKEDIDPPGKSTEKGWLPGFYLGWSYNKKNDIYSKVLIEFSYGETEYDGTTQSGTPISFSNDNDQFLFRGEWNIGYNFVIAKDISLKPYAGYGYRYWSRGDAKVTATYASYKERYYWHYLPVGMRADVTLGDKLFIEPNAGFRWMFYGRMTAYLSELDPGYNDPEFKLGNKLGWYAEIPVRYKFSPYWSVVVKPWYEYSKIGKSNDDDLTYCGYYDGTYYEPASRTHQYGLNVGLVASY